VAEARPGGAALVDERVDVREAFCARRPCPGAPRVRDELELIVGELGE
jgi:hypothetical protein